MLVMLLPDQVSRNWDEIKMLLEEATPGPQGGGLDRMNNILEDILIGKKKLWVSYNTKDEFDGLVGTEIYVDRINSLKTMEIFAVWGKGAEEHSWDEGWTILVKYAVKEKCSRIVAFTKEPTLIERAKKLGADTNFTFIDIPLGN